MILANGGVTVTLGKDGRFDVEGCGMALMGCRPLIEMGGFELENRAPWCTLRADDTQIVLEAANLAAVWQLTFRKAETPHGRRGIAIRLSGKLNGAAHDLVFAPLAGGSAVGATHLLGQGRAMGRAQSLTMPREQAQKVSMFYNVVLSTPGSHLHLSMPLRDAFLPEFSCVAGAGVGEFQLACRIGNETPAEADSGELMMIAGEDPFVLLDEWAEDNRTVKKEFGNILQYGWNSWDYYRWTITEEEVLENARFIAADPVLSRKIKRIIVDDGWQYCYGEWDANPLFPHGMAYLAEELTKLGFEPGLWIAPTLIEPQSRIAQLNPEMLGMSEGGQPTLCFECMRRYGFVLDPTRADVQEHLRKLFDRYASMGYRYFKLDFMAATLLAPRRYDETVPCAEIPRLIVKAAYEGVAGRAAILGCNYIFAGGNEYVDAVRVGGDIHARWDSIKHNVTSVAANMHMNKRMWINDPDFSLARSMDVSQDGDLHRLNPMTVFTEPGMKYDPQREFSMATMTLEEAKVLLSVVVANGGAINLSDKMTRLGERELDLLRRTVSAEGGDTARALDLFESEQPGKWVQRVGEFDRVLLINWGDEEEEGVISLKGVKGRRAKDFWTDEEWTVAGDELRVTLPPHGCRFVELR